MRNTVVRKEQVPFSLSISRFENIFKKCGIGSLSIGTDTMRQQAMRLLRQR